MTKPEPLGWLREEMQTLRSLGLARHPRETTGEADGWRVVDGRRLRDFASNDYLNLASDPRVVAAASAVLKESGAGAGASPLVCGRTEWHARLEERLAAWERQPAAILFPSGFAANVGTIGALVGEGDTVWCDRHNHASLVDGCRLSGARLRVYRHVDLDRLERDMRNCPAPGKRLVVTDSVFSMEGDVAPLPQLCSLAERYGAMLLVDEAHATGVFGAAGRGVAEWQGVEERVSLRVGTLSKALGALGGFVTGPRDLVDWLWNRARTQVFSTALPAAMCAAALAALEIVEQEPQRRERLHQRAEQLRSALASHPGINVPAGVGPIVPVVLQTPQRAMQVAAALEERGYLVGAIRPPSVPQGTSRLRITISAAHGEEEIARLAETLAELVTVDSA
ncbi:MAG: 8-amino-7-oxononanoate synthase [Planctomycetales bacterium]